MTKRIAGAEYTLSKIFSSDFEYVIPSYQRPYSWTVDEASVLFDDLIDFHGSEREEGYFLGSIVLIKQEDAPLAEVVDGQQRLTTLTILLAALASQFSGEARATLYKYIQEPGDPFEGLEAKPRLTLRERDQDFFAKYVQSLELHRLADLDEKNLENESQVNIKKNSELYLRMIAERFTEAPGSLENFVKFLVRRCFLVAVSTPSQRSAFRVFSVMNSRGLDLQATDIIKADVIGKISTAEKRDDFQERWEDMEVELGRGGFNDLFSYVRMIYAKEKAKKSLLEEFREHVLSRHPEPEKLIGDLLEPFASALSKIRSSHYEAVSHAEQINAYLRWLNRIDNSDWVPVAMLFLSKHENQPEYVEWYFGRLERLAAYMHICALNINERIDRYKAVIESLEQPNDLVSPANAVELTESEKERMRDALDGNIYQLTARRRNYLILRLDAFMADGGALYDPNVLTIEHVLPQSVSEDSEWAQLWPEEELRQEWVHRIANLVPLNRRRNSSAQNYDFEKKKKKYFSGKSNVSSYVLTTQVLNTDRWTPEHVLGRQAALLDVLQDKWRLGPD